MNAQTTPPSRPRTGPSAATLPSLTGIRAAAALLVFGLHLRNLGYLNPSADSIASWAFNAGTTGVSLFFVLSGFVLTWSAGSRDTARAFWRRRVARIYPLHLVTAAIALVLAPTVLPLTQPTKPQLAANLLLIHSWWPNWWQTLDPVSWSLSCEAFFYAIFPALSSALRRFGPHTLTAITAVAVLSVVALPWVNTHYGLDLVLYSSPLARLPEFVIGVAAGHLVRRDKWRGPNLETAVAVTIIGYFFTARASVDYAFAACTIPGFAVLVPAIARADLRGYPSPWRHPAIVRFGELSYAFYLIHLLFLLTASPTLTALPTPIGAVLALIVSLALAWLLHEGIERPARELLLRGRRTEA